MMHILQQQDDVKGHKSDSKPAMVSFPTKIAHQGDYNRPWIELAACVFLDLDIHVWSVSEQDWTQTMWKEAQYAHREKQIEPHVVIEAQENIRGMFYNSPKAPCALSRAVKTE